MSFPSAVWLGSPLSLPSKGGKECTTTTSSSSFVVTAARVFLMAALGQVIPQLPVAGRKLLCEAIGTFYLVLTVSMCLQQSEKLFAPIAIGFQLMNQIFAYGYISGGHLNPAVTGGIYFSGLMPLGDAVKYVLSQTTGGVLASLFSWFLVGVSGDFKSPTPATTTALGVFRAFCCEWIYTAGLVSVVLNVACSRQKENHHYGMAIGMTVLAAAFSVGGISGGAFNPAVATSLQLVECAATSCEPLKYFWVYWLAPFVAALTSSVLFLLIHPPEYAHKPAVVVDTGSASKPFDLTGDLGKSFAPSALLQHNAAGGPPYGTTQ